jgi:hypothetical protein
MPSLIVFRSSVNTIIYPYTYPIRATDKLAVVTRSGLATTKFPSTNCEYALRFCVIFVYISYQLSSIIVQAENPF